MARASDVLELQPITCAEAVGMFLAAAGFLVGGWLGATLGNVAMGGSFASWTTAGVLGLCIGGMIGLATAANIWRKSARPTSAQNAQEFDVIPDRYMEGPTLNPVDELGNPRY
jgi:hypothetical protein